MIKEHFCERQAVKYQNPVVPFNMRKLFLGIAVMLAACTSESEYFQDRKMEPYDQLWLMRSWPEFQPDVRAMNEVIHAVREADGHRNEDTPWRLEGPQNIGGRINVIAVHPVNPDIIWVGNSTGGAYKSDDGGYTWTPKTDALDHLAIGDIAFAPSNPDILFLGTGDPNISGIPHPGGGIYKSTDGGETWTYSGLAEASIVSKIAIHPENPDIVYAGTMGLPFERNFDRGLYKSEDGGQTWSLVFNVNDESGVIDLIMRPDDPETLFVAIWNRIRNNQESLVSGDDARIWKSTDGGNSWTMLENGLPLGPQSRIGLEIKANEPDKMWAIVVGTDLQLEGIYRTSDAGENWTNIYNGFDLEEALGGFGWYFGKIRVNPNDENEVTVLGVDLWTTFDNGVFWNMSCPPWYFYEVHADKHDMVYLPNGDILLATDGGLYRTSDQFGSWSDTDDIPNTQFYRVALDPHNPNYYTGGAQDNGTTTGNYEDLNGWVRDYGGDGFQCVYDPIDPELRYMETQNGNIVVEYSGFVDDFTFGIENEDRRNWDMPYVMSDFDNAEFITGTYRVYHMTDAPFGTWEPISFDLTDGNIFGPTYHTISTVAIDRYNGNTFFAGTTDGNVWRGNAGGVWTSITGTLPNRYVTCIETSRETPQRVWVTHSGYKDNDNLSHIHRSDNNGQTWIDISGDLPEQPINRVRVLNDTLLFVATDLGVYHTADGGVHWERVGNNMPYIPVFDLAIDTTNHRLVAGTFARSMMSFPTDSLFNWPAEDPGIGLSEIQEPRPVAYPNPAQDYVQLSHVSQAEITLFDLNGRQVMSVQNVRNGQSIDLRNLKSGKYVMIIREKGRIFTQAVLKL
ncbi:MAG: hypothetical protein RL226_2161 [Bacteroidota bacterium]